MAACTIGGVNFTRLLYRRGRPRLYNRGVKFTLVVVQDLGWRWHLHAGFCNPKVPQEAYQKRSKLIPEPCLNTSKEKSSPRATQLGLLREDVAESDAAWGLLREVVAESDAAWALTRGSSITSEEPQYVLR